MLRQQGAQDPEKEVTVEVPLVDLVHDQHLVLRQRFVLLDLSEQQPLSEEQQFGGRGPGGLKADLVTHLQSINTRCKLILIFTLGVYYRVTAGDTVGDDI